mgnify:CR=1 FL=1
MRLTLEISGKRPFTVTFALERPQPVEAAPRDEPQPQGSTCGVLERTPSWDHDVRVPVGFAGRIDPMPDPSKPKEI